jgi:TMEM175 potassium channel family protein
VTTNRLESFSDGVLAVAITLLVLNIQVPTPGQGSLGHELARQWPEYAAYATSFLTIGIIWVNHHAMISRLRVTDHAILMLNLVLLLTIGLIPFATALLATYLREGHGQNLAAGIYGGAFLAMAIAFATLNWHILFPKAHLLAPELPEERRRRILMRSVSGVGPYVIATALAVFSPYPTLVISFALAAYYALPLASSFEPG